MEKASKKLLRLFNNGGCDYDQCRQLIREIGGCTKIISDQHGFQTTPLLEAVRNSHYDFALELIGEAGADLNVLSDFETPLIWDLQYLDAHEREEQWVESEQKLRLVRKLIAAGANPNPISDGEELLNYIRFELNEGNGSFHLWEMEHIIEAHAYGETKRFIDKLKEQPIRSVLLSRLAFLLIDDTLCDCDHAVFLFEDGERMALSSYQVGENEWDFYAVPVRKNIILDPAMYQSVVAYHTDFIKFLSWYTDKDFPTSHWIDLSIDDAILRIHADEPSITVGIVCDDFEKYEQMKRKKLFSDKA